MAIERKKDKYGNKMRHRGGALLRMTAAIVFWLLVWQLLSFLIGSELLLPSPWAVCAVFAGLRKQRSFTAAFCIPFCVLRQALQPAWQQAYLQAR